jgi:hypothetical protein
LWWCSRDPGARFRDGVEVLVQPDEVDHIATRLAAETRKALTFKIDKEARRAIRMEWTQPLPAMRTGPFQFDACPLNNVE